MIKRFLEASRLNSFDNGSNMGAFVNTGDVGRGTQPETFRSEKNMVLRLYFCYCARKSRTPPKIPENPAPRGTSDAKFRVEASVTHRRYGKKIVAT